MAYRDAPNDPRIIELEALIASEPALRTQIVPLRLEEDELHARDNVIGTQLSEAEAQLAKRRAGGVVATLSGWFGRPIEEHEADVARLTAEHAQVTTRIAEVMAAERDLRMTLESVDAARSELADLRARAIETLRAAPGPQGDEMRALDIDDARDRGRRAAIIQVLDIVDSARTAVWQIQAVLGDLDQMMGGMTSVTAVLERIDSPLSVSTTHAERENTRERLGEAIGDAAAMLRKVIATYDVTECEWFATMSPRRVLELAAAEPTPRIEETVSVRNSDALIECMFQLARGLAEQRDRLAQHAVERAARRQVLTEQTWLAT